MKLLYLTDRCPWPPTSGGLLRHARLIEALAARNDTRIVILDEPTDRCPFPEKTEFIPIPKSDALSPLSNQKWSQRIAVLKAMIDPFPELFRRYRDDSTRQTFIRLRSLAADQDACWVTSSYYADIALESWANPRLVVDYIDVNSLSQISHLRQLAATPHKLFTFIDTLKLAWHERRVASRSWRVVVCKEEDSRFLGQPRKTYVVPNGTDLQPNSDRNSELPGNLLFVGLMSYYPNAEGVCWFVRECMPLLTDLNVRIDLVGRDPGESVKKLEDGTRVRVHGYVPDLSFFYNQSAVVVAPIRLGSGTKLKVLEALSYGKALVATSEAARGIDIRHGIEFLRADTPQEMANACRLLLNDHQLRTKLGSAGRKLVEERYTWDRVGELAQLAIAP